MSQPNGSEGFMPPSYLIPRPAIIDFDIVEVVPTARIDCRRVGLPIFVIPGKITRRRFVDSLPKPPAKDPEP